MQPPDRRTGLLYLLVAPEPPELGPGPRPGVETLPSLNSRLDHALPSGAFSSVRRDLVRGLILLWHDHLDAAHTLVQAIENPDGSYVHGILHRREPDYGNAGYWFHRVGQHPAFAALAERASTLLTSQGKPALLRQLVPHGQWDASAFIDACKAVASRPPSDPQVKLLRAIQAAEFHGLLEYFCDAGDPTRPAGKSGKGERR